MLARLRTMTLSLEQMNETLTTGVEVLTGRACETNCSIAFILQSLKQVHRRLVLMTISKCMSYSNVVNGSISIDIVHKDLSTYCHKEV